MLNEESIKAHLAEYLVKRNYVANGVLIHEKVYGTNNMRRADIVVANGKLHAYEIKSDHDSLKRLPGQLKAYTENFDKVTVVCTSKYVSHLIENLSLDIGIIEVLDLKSGPAFKRINAGRSIQVKNKKILCDFLTVTELLSLLKTQGLKEPKRTLRKNLIPLARTLPVIVLRRFVLKSIKNRYQGKFTDYLKSRSTASIDEAFKSLTCAYKSIMEPIPTLELPENVNIVDYSGIYPDGDMPAATPKYVLKRRVINHHQSKSSSSTGPFVK